MKRLNFGCGYDIRKGWVNVDKVRHGDHDLYDILGKWPYPDGEFDQIYAGHVLHMFDYQELPVVLKKFYDMLKPNGYIDIVEFDPIKAFEAYKRGDAAALVIPDNVEPTLDGKFNAYLTWYSTRRTILTARGMAEKLGRAGFHTTYNENNKLVDRPAESYYVMGLKK